MKFPSEMFQDELDKKCSASTKKQRLSALLSFSKYAQNRDFDAACTFRSVLLKIPMKKTQHRKRSVFSIEEVSIIHFNGHEATLDINGKGGKARKVLIPSPCSKMLKEYISYRRIADQPDRHIFSSQTHEYLSVAGIEVLESGVPMAVIKNFLGHATPAAYIDRPDLFRYRNTGFACSCHNLSSVIVVK